MTTAHEVPPEEPIAALVVTEADRVALCTMVYGDPAHPPSPEIQKAVIEQIKSLESRMQLVLANSSVKIVTQPASSIEKPTPKFLDRFRRQRLVRE